MKQYKFFSMFVASTLFLAQIASAGDLTFANPQSVSIYSQQMGAGKYIRVSTQADGRLHFDECQRDSVTQNESCHFIQRNEGYDPIAFSNRFQSLAKRAEYAEVIGTVTSVVLGLSGFLIGYGMFSRLGIGAGIAANGSVPGFGSGILIGGGGLFFGSVAGLGLGYGGAEIGQGLKLLIGAGITEQKQEALTQLGQALVAEQKGQNFVSFDVSFAELETSVSALLMGMP